MKRFIVNWFVQTIALLAVAHMVAGIFIADWQTAIIAALVLGILNVFLRPLIILLTLPLTILTLGLFTFIINGVLFYAASGIVQGFVVADLWSAIGGSMLFSLISFLLNMFLKPEPRKNTIHPQNAARYRNVIDVETVDDRKNTGNDERGKYLS